MFWLAIILLPKNLQLNPTELTHKSMLESKLRGRYEIIKKLGSGGFSETYLARDWDFPGTPLCVVKQLKPHSSKPWILQTARRLFESEAAVLARLGFHPQIPQLMAHFEENEQFYLVQEFVAGEPLSEELRTGKRWSEAEAIAFLQDVLGILLFVHQQNVIHRDLKPANLIRRSLDGRFVLIDFGSVKRMSALVANASEPTELTIAIGAPAYMPIEQLRGKPNFNSDLYALGKIVIQGLTGVAPEGLSEDPETGEVVWQEWTQVSEAFATLVERMVRWSDHQRYQSADEVLADLKSFPTLNALPTLRLPSSVASAESAVLDEVFRNLKQHAEIARIKKLIFYAYKNRWENDSRKLLSYRTKELVKALYQANPTLEQFSNTLYRASKTLNKKDKYFLIAEAIIDCIRQLYETDQPLPPVPPFSDPLSIASDPSLPQETSSNSQTQTILDEQDFTCDPFELRLEVMRYTTPLRAKVLLFSVLHYPFSFRGQDWSVIATYDFDELLIALLKTFPTLEELESRLYGTAKTLKELREGLQIAGAIVQALRPFYKKFQPTSQIEQAQVPPSLGKR